MQNKLQYTSNFIDKLYTKNYNEINLKFKILNLKLSYNKCP